MELPTPPTGFVLERVDRHQGRPRRGRREDAELGTRTEEAPPAGHAEPREDAARRADPASRARGAPFDAADATRAESSGAHAVRHGGPAVLELRRVGERPGTGIRCDLSSISLRGGAQEARSMPVVRAVGDARRVVDATSGLLGDAFLLAAAGLEVLALERSPVVHALAADGLARAAADPRLSALLGGRLRLERADARARLDEIAGTSDAPDAVLLDPMFPPKKRRSALPRKEMLLLREAVGCDEDAAELLAAARRAAGMRVVLKRGDDAPELASPDWTIPGTTVRFDVFRPSGS